MHQQAGAPVHPLDAGLDHGDDGHLPLLLERAAQVAGDLDRLLGGLDEQLDRAVAAEAPAPDRLVVGGEVEVHQARLAAGHHVHRELLDVSLQAAAADVADQLAGLGDEQPRPGTPVGGAPHRHDGGKSHLLNGGDDTILLQAGPAQGQRQLCLPP